MFSNGVVVAIYTTEIEKDSNRPVVWHHRNRPSYSVLSSIEFYNQKKMKVLLIDDDRNHLESISDALVLNGIETSLFLNPVEALESFYSCSYDAVITDIRMSEMDGVKVLEKILKFNPETHVIVMTGFPFPGDSVITLNKGACAFFHKPLDIDNVLQLLTEINKKLSNGKEKGSDIE